MLYNTHMGKMVQQPQTLRVTKQLVHYNLVPLWIGTKLNYPDSSTQWADSPNPWVL